MRLGVYIETKEDWSGAIRQQTVCSLLRYRIYSSQEEMEYLNEESVVCPWSDHGLAKLSFRLFLELLSELWVVKILRSEYGMLINLSHPPPVCSQRLC